MQENEQHQQLFDTWKAREDEVCRVVDEVLSRLLMRDNELREKIVDYVVRDTTDEGFVAALEFVFVHLECSFESLAAVGFTSLTLKYWRDGEKLPPVESRELILRLILNSYFVAEGSLEASIRRCLGTNVSVSEAGKFPLSTPLAEIEGWRNVMRNNWLINGGFYCLGDLVAHTADEISKVWNYGPVSLKKTLAPWLLQLGYAPLKDGAIVPEELQVFRTNTAVRKILLHKYDAGGRCALPTEYYDDEVRCKVSVPEELIAGLKESNITTRGQLATAPCDVVDAICAGHPEWRDFLRRLAGRLELGTEIPPGVSYPDCYAPAEEGVE